MESFLRDELKASIIAFNIYEAGTHIQFMLMRSEEDSCDEVTSIEVTMPGINTFIMEVGLEYFVASVRDDEALGMKQLASIKNDNAQMSLLFTDGYEIDLFTRGHVLERRAIIHRVDYHVLAKDIGEELIKTAFRSGVQNSKLTNEYLPRFLEIISKSSLK